MSLKSFFQNSRQKERLIKWALLIFLATLVLSFSFFRTFDSYENIFVDARFKLRPLQSQSDKIVIIEVSDDTLKGLGYWPIPRDFHASLIDVLSYFGVRQAMFDFIFTDQTDKDEAFRESLENAGNVYLPFVLKLEEKIPAGEISRAKSFAASVVPSLEKTSRGTGFINALRDSDGKTRHIPLLADVEGVRVPHIALRMFCDYIHIPVERLDIQKDFVRIGNDLKIPTSAKGMMLVNYAGKWNETFRHYSYIDILASWNDIAQGKKPRVDLAALKDSICFIGLTATGTPDLQSMPLQNDYPMVGLHANVFNSLLSRNFVYRACRFLNIFILLILLGIVYAVTMRFKNKPVIAFGWTAGYALLFLAFSFALFFSLGACIDVFYPVALMLCFNMGLNVYNFIEESKRVELVEKELSIAKKIQESFLPSPLEEFNGLEIASHMLTAKHVGGDLYDIEPLSRNQLGILIGDVSGKGVPAALVMAKTISMFRMLAFGVDEPSDLLFQLNEEMHKNSTSGIFVTATYLIYNSSTRKVLMASAGHSATLVIRKKDSQIEKILPKEGMPLGLMDRVEFSQEEVTLGPGDKIVLYTDGIVEAKNLNREDFGEARLESLVKASSALDVKSLISSIEAHIQSFAGKAPQHDDCTLIVLKQAENNG